MPKLRVLILPVRDQQAGRSVDPTALKGQPATLNGNLTHRQIDEPRLASASAHSAGSRHGLAGGLLLLVRPVALILLRNQKPEALTKGVLRRAIKSPGRPKA